jgi:hypothetical protein
MGSLVWQFLTAVDRHEAVEIMLTLPSGDAVLVSNQEYCRQESCRLQLSTARNPKTMVTMSKTPSETKTELGSFYCKIAVAQELLGPDSDMNKIL